MKDILAIPAGGIVGFGLGHSLQNRYDSRGGLYTLIDVIIIAAIPLVVMGDCAPSDQSCKDNQSRNGAVLSVAFWGSRIAQAIDLSLFFSGQSYSGHDTAEKKSILQFFVTPGENKSFNANLAWAF